MEHVEVERALNRVAYNRSQWNKAKHEFDKAAEKVTHRLLLEAAVAKMSVHQVSRCLQITPKRTRELMRRFGMNTKSSRTLLAKDAAEALHANADLMGIDVKNFDLMSPLAYLPAGSVMKQQLSGVSKVTEVDWQKEATSLQEQALSEFEEAADDIAHYREKAEQYYGMLTQLGFCPDCKTSLPCEGCGAGL